MHERVSPEVKSRINDLTFREGEVVEGIGNYEKVDPVIRLLLVRFWQIRMDKKHDEWPRHVMIDKDASVSRMLRTQADKVHLDGQLQNYQLTTLSPDADLKVLQPRAYVDHKLYTPNNEKINVLLTSEYYSNGELFGLIPTLLRLYTSWSDKGVYVSPNLSPLNATIKTDIDKYLSITKNAAYWKTILSLLNPLDVNVES